MKDCCKHDKNKLYDTETDAYVCGTCGQYLEEDCGDPSCQFCVKRRHSKVNESKTALDEEKKGTDKHVALIKHGLVGRNEVDRL